MQCQYCGHANAPEERRCTRCGRRLEPRQTVPRMLDEPPRGSRPVVPLPVRDRPSGAGVPAPRWKRELEEKLETYRVRQRRDDEGGADRLKGLRLPPQKVIAFSESEQKSEQTPAGSAEPGSESQITWRRIQRKRSAEVLPPLGRAADRTAGAAASRHPALSHKDSTGLKPAPLLIRALAGLLDFTLVLVALGVFVAVFHFMGRFLESSNTTSALELLLNDETGLRAVMVVLSALIVFYWIFYLRFIGESPGMTWVGLRIVSFDGAAATPSQLWGRALGTILSTAAAGLGFAWAIADEEQLTWHDRMSKTFVARQIPQPEDKPTESSLAAVAASGGRSSPP